MINALKTAWSGSHDPFSISVPTIISPQPLKLVTKICMHVEYISCWPWYDKLPLVSVANVT